MYYYVLLLLYCTSTYFKYHVCIMCSLQRVASIPRRETRPQLRFHDGSRHGGSTRYVSHSTAHKWASPLSTSRVSHCVGRSEREQSALPPGVDRQHQHERWHRRPREYGRLGGSQVPRNHRQRPARCCSASSNCLTLPLQSFILVVIHTWVCF